MTIWQHENFSDGGERVIVMMTDVSDASTNPVFVGHGKAQVMAPNGQVGTLQMQFQIEAETLDQAFALYDQTKAEQQKAVVAEMSKPKIAIPRPGGNGRARRL